MIPQEISKRSLRTPQGINQDFIIKSYIKDGVNPAKICTLLNINKKTLQNHLTTLKNRGEIKKVSYGAWEIIAENDKKEVFKTPRYASDTSQLPKTSFKPDSVRAHAFIFTFEVPNNFRNWEKRTEILKQLGIEYKELSTFGGAQQIEFKGRKVWLTKKSIVINEKASYFGDTSADTKSYAVNDALELIKGIEGLLKANLGRYRFRISRQHYALIKNALAKQYDREDKKLYVADQGGYWFIVDNSFNLHEAETIHTQTALNDNKKVQDFFNGIKQYEGFTPQLIINSIGQNAKNLDNYAVHLRAHVDSVKQLGINSEKLGNAVEKLVIVIKSLSEGEKTA